jgi:large subunit ribosomal protein L21
MYAVIQTGGKQYKVKKGDAVLVELLPLDLGATTTFTEILMVGGGSGEAH